MKTTLKNISLLLCALTALASCYRKPLYSDCLCHSTIAIPIDVEWEVSGVTPQNVSVLFYDAEDGTLVEEHTYEHNSRDIQSYAHLQSGRYTAVIFNELRNQIDYMSCVGHKNLSTLKFQSNAATPLRSRAETRSYIKQTGDLAVVVVEDIVVTEDMIVEAGEAEYAAKKAAEKSAAAKAPALSPATQVTVDKLMGVTPLKKNTTIKVSAHFNNIYYARMPALVDLVNLSDGYYVSGDKNSTTPSTVQFTMNNRTYDQGSLYDGTIYATIVTFGTLEDRASTDGHSQSPILLDVLFKKVDEAQTEEDFKVDVTNMAQPKRQNDGSYLITIDTDFETPLTPVEPEGSDGDSGFNTEVEDWDQVDVPLNQ